MKASFFSLTEAKYAAGDTIKHTVFDNVESAQVRPTRESCRAAHPARSPLYYALYGMQGGCILTCTGAQLGCSNPHATACNCSLDPRPAAHGASVQIGARATSSKLAHWLPWRAAPPMASSARGATVLGAALYPCQC